MFFGQSTTFQAILRQLKMADLWPNRLIFASDDSEEHFTPIPITMTLLQYRLQDNSTTTVFLPFKL